MLPFPGNYKGHSVPDTATVEIDGSGKIISFKFGPKKNGKINNVDVTGYTIFETLGTAEADTFHAIIKYTLRTGQATIHIHYFKWHDEPYLRHATIEKSRNGDMVTVKVKPYP